MSANKGVENDVPQYSEEEVENFRAYFQEHTDDDQCVSVAKLESVLLTMKRYDATDVSRMVEESGLSTNDRVSFDKFLQLLWTQDSTQRINDEEPDQKVLNFLKILNEYRLKCEEECKYLEAGSAKKKIETLRAQERKRLRKAKRASHIIERQQLQMAQNIQHGEFKKAWENYLEEYDKMAQMYIQQMTERHAVNLKLFQERLHKKMVEQPSKFSKELLEWRRRQYLLAKQKNYAEAEKIKKIADVMEERENKSTSGSNREKFERQEMKLKQTQEQELHALLKRIEQRRQEHMKQFQMDLNRLNRRNKNSHASLARKQNKEFKSFDEANANILRYPERYIAKQKAERESKMSKQSKPEEQDSTTFLTES